MRLYRISKSEHAKTSDEAMSGEGGLHGSARWHNKGRRIVYTATSTALATLEIAVNLRTSTLIPAYKVIEVDIPDDQVMKLTPIDLPPGWDETKAEPLVSRSVGDLWLTSKIALGLMVPSVVVPEHYNVLINPLHPEFGQIHYGDPMSFPFDPRIKR
jgi:RES domain-containing protein